MKILLFGVLQDIVGERSIRIDTEIANSLKTVSELKAFINGKYPLFRGITSIAVAVNMEYAADDKAIQITDEIAFIPPVSGG
jgi:molybdopterin synthase sulfur carrier subunit